MKNSSSSLERAGDDAVDGRHHLAELSGAEATGSKCAFGLISELNVVREKRVLGVFGHQGSFRLRAPQLCPYARQHSLLISRLMLTNYDTNRNRSRSAYRLSEKPIKPP